MSAHLLHAPASFKPSGLAHSGPVRHQRRTSHRRPRSICAAASSSSPGQFLDYYKLLDISQESTTSDIKRAYRYLQKRCHPDISGNELGHEMGVLLNEAYSALTDPITRQHHDKTIRNAKKYGDYTGEALSRWNGPPGEQRATFVDEGACIGCLKCALQASSTFAIEMRHGKARTVTQWGDPEEDIEQAINICPVSCIHWVGQADLPALEYTMRREMKETHGRPTKGGVFDAAALFLKKRESESGGVDGQAWQAWASSIGPFSPDTRQAASASIHRRSQGGTASWWHIKTGGEHSVTDSCAIVRGSLSTPAGAPAFAASSKALEYLLEVAQRRARKQTGPAYATAFSTAPAGEVEDYWQPQKSTALAKAAHSDDGHPQISRGFVDTRTPTTPRRTRFSKEAIERRKRAESRNMMILGAIVCLMVCQVSSTVPTATDPGPGGGQSVTMSAEECYRRGGGVCRFFIK